MKQYGNSYWQEATDNKDKTVAIMSDEVFQDIYQNIEKSGLNYCAYSDGKTAMVAVNKSNCLRRKNGVPEIEAASAAMSTSKTRSK